MPSSSHPLTPLRVIVTDNANDANGSCRPFPSFGRSVACQYPGWCLEIISILIRSGNISATWMVEEAPPGESIDIGKTEEPNSSIFSGILGRVQTGAADVACVFFQKSEIRAKQFDFSVPVSQIQPIFLVHESPPKSPPTSLLFTCLQPFSGDVWLCFFLCLFLQMLIWSVMGGAERRLGWRARTRSFEFAWMVLGDMFNGTTHEFRSYAGELARFVLLIFQTSLFTNLYTSLLLSALLSPPNNAEIKSAADAVRLIAAGKYTWIVHSSYWFYEETTASPEPFFTSLREAARLHPPMHYDHDAMSILTSGNFILSAQEDSREMIAAAGICNVLRVSQGLPQKSVHFIFAKGNPWRKIIDVEIAKNYAAIDEIYSYYFKRRQWPSPKCPSRQYQPASAKDPINIWSVYGVFMLGMGALAFASVICVLEVIMDHIALYRRKRL